MTFARSLLAIVIAGVFSFPAQAEQDRTVNRSPEGQVYRAEPLFAKPEFHQFLPRGFDPKNSHPAQWDGQDWDASAWNPEYWTPDDALRRLYANHTFHRQYLRGKMPVIEVGPTFWKLSDLDRRRALKLMADHTGIFDRGYDSFLLRDWYTKDTVGSYTRSGMHLN